MSDDKDEKPATAAEGEALAAAINATMCSLFGGGGVVIFSAERFRQRQEEFAAEIERGARAVGPDGKTPSGRLVPKGRKGRRR